MRHNQDEPTRCPHGMEPGPRKGQCYECWYAQPMKVLRHNKVITEYTRSRARGNRPPSDLGPRILEAVRAADRRNETPSVRELQTTCRISSTSVVMYHLRQLAKDGDIALGPRGISRSYRMTDQGRGYPSDEDMLRRCLDYFERELSAVGPLIEDLKARLETSR